MASRARAGRRVRWGAGRAVCHRHCKKPASPAPPPLAALHPVPGRPRFRFPATVVSFGSNKRLRTTTQFSSDLCRALRGRGRSRREGDHRAGAQGTPGQDTPSLRRPGRPPATRGSSDPGESCRPGPGRHPCSGAHPVQVREVIPGTGCEPFTEMCVERGLGSGDPDFQPASVGPGAPGAVRAGDPALPDSTVRGLRRVRAPPPTGAAAVTPLCGADASPPARGPGMSAACRPPSGKQGGCEELLRSASAE